MSGNNYLHTNWQCPSARPILTDSRIHVWRASLELLSSQIDFLATVLSPDEIARAEKFRFARHRRRFIAARGILRQLLGNYLEIAPSQVKFGYSDRGKPFLSQPMVSNSLQFNVSHSEEYALYGFALNHQIGVDVEYLRRMPDAVNIARRFFSPAELNLVQNAAPPERHHLFFQLWTAKEAYLKAIGTGLTGMLDNIEIALDQNLRPSFWAIAGDRQAVTNWTLCSCSPATDYVGAIAIHLPYEQFELWHWDANYPTAI